MLIASEGMLFKKSFYIKKIGVRVWALGKAFRAP
jgi:hypothetical protein